MAKPSADYLLMHIGHPKTGTSSIQAALLKSRSALMRQSVLHPETTSRSGNNNALAAHIFGAEAYSVPRLRREGRTRQDLLEASDKAWARFIGDVSRHRPAKVVLSSEQFFRVVTPEQEQPFQKALAEVAREVEILAYLRSPVTFFLSSLQQRLKFYRPPRTPPASRLRPVLESMAKNLPGCLTLRVFDRALLSGGDVVRDFFANSLPEIDIGTLSFPKQEQNVTHSAEAMALLQENHQGQIRLARDPEKAARAIRLADLAVTGGTRPVFHPHMRQAAIDRSADDLLWLRDAQGVMFPDIDYEQIRPLSGEDPMLQATRIADICPVDATRKAEVLALAKRKAAWWMLT